MLDHNNLEEFSDPVNYDFEDAPDNGVDFYSPCQSGVLSPR